MFEINWPVLAGVIVLLNVISFALVGRDKAKSVARSERVPEVYFFFLAVFFASAGVFLGLFAFRHKTNKIYFPLGIGLLLLQQLCLLYFAYLLLM
ncbi:MAG: DUF1294 domain-containing protein [Candidatus Doudnabacteria bacterium]|nr:DUF1294 domain-containing protein [Candidatus Doudnabacteria bacterium]